MLCQPSSLCMWRAQSFVTERLGGYYISTLQCAHVNTRDSIEVRECVAVRCGVLRCAHVNPSGRSVGLVCIMMRGVRVELLRPARSHVLLFLSFVEQSQAS